jgi:hypothetical protein
MSTAARPTAALLNAATPRPTARAVWPKVASPAEFCQLVFVVKLTEVLKASAGGTAW